MRVLQLSLALSLIACLAAVLGGCGSQVSPYGDPESTSPHLYSPSTSMPTAAQTNAWEAPTVAPADAPGPTPTPTFRPVKPFQVSATTKARPEPASSPVHAVTTDPGPAPTAIVEPIETPIAQPDEGDNAGTGYVLTDEQEDGAASASNNESSDAYRAGITKASGTAGIQGQSDTVEGRPYTWEDGDRTLTVLLQSGLTVGDDGEITVVEESQEDVVTVDSRGDAVTRSSKGDTGEKTASLPVVVNEAQPVFRSESGELMTLPGGVLLALDPEWSEAESDTFFSSNGIELSRVSDLGFISNGFFVETEPGFPSLNLANALVGQDGVVLSSPNWWTEIATE